MSHRRARSRSSRNREGGQPCAPTSSPEASFPTTSCPITRDTPRKLSELQGDDPLILTLARGHYCPKEHQQHLELAAFYPRIAVAYTRIATIATDDHHTLQEFRASVGAQWPFLSDPDRTVQKDLDIQEYTDPEHNPMIPHTLVLKPGLVIHRIYNGYWFWGRPSVVDLWHDLREVSSEIRPDWDLSTPGLRERVGRGRPRPSTGGTSGKVSSREEISDGDQVIRRKHSKPEPAFIRVAARFRPFDPLAGDAGPDRCASRSRSRPSAQGSRPRARARGCSRLQATDGRWGGAAWNRGWNSTMHVLMLLRGLGSRSRERPGAPRGGPRP